HVARHARRTVNPPDDTWVAFAGDRRGYKKDAHFKVAVSRGALRLLFELGPEYYDKAEWAMAWRREAEGIGRALGSSRKLAWFRNEHGEDPAAPLAKVDLAALVEDLVRRKDGQLVLGRRLDAARAAAMTPAAFRRAALETFKL